MRIRRLIKKKTAETKRPEIPMMMVIVSYRVKEKLMRPRFFILSFSQWLVDVLSEGSDASEVEKRVA